MQTLGILHCTPVLWTCRNIDQSLDPALLPKDILDWLFTQMDRRSWRFGIVVALDKQFAVCFSVYTCPEGLVWRYHTGPLHRFAESRTNIARFQCGSGRRYPGSTCVWNSEASDVEK